VIDFARNGTPTLLDHRGNPLRPTRDGAPHPEAAGLSLPHSWTFVARVGGGNNTYWHDRWDEALRHSREDAEVMRRDAFLMSLLEERKRSVHQLPWELEIPDEKDRFQVEVRDGLTKAIRSIPHLPYVLWWWLDAVWYGRTAVQFLWGWDRGTVQGRRTLRVLDCAPIHGDKIGHQFDGTPYVLVDAARASMLREADLITTTAGGRGLRVVGPWADRILFHQHLIEDVDFFQADQGEAIHGVGVRHKIFWLNFLKLEWLANITDFFSRVGLGITLWEYEAGNTQALAAVKQAANDQSERAHIFVPVTPDAGGKPRGGVQRIEVPTSGADALVKLIQYIDATIERYVIGQEASSKASASGLGNEASAEFQRDTKRQIAAFDAALAGVSFTGTPRQQGIVALFKRCTYPEADFPVTWKFNLESGESKDKLDAIKTVVEMGVKVKTDEARKAAGLSKPVDGDETIDPEALKQQEAGGAGGGLGGLLGVPGAGGGAGAAPGAEGEEQPLQEGQGDDEQGDDAPSADADDESGDGAGSFLASIRHARRADVLRFLREAGYGDVAAVLRYGWVNKGKAADGKRNVWVGTDEHKGQRRVQIGEPGSGRGRKQEGAAAPKPGRQEQPTAPRQPAARRAAPKGQRPTVEQVQGELEGLDRANLSADAVMALGDRLLSLSHEELRELRGRLGLTKGKGPKGELAQAILVYIRGEGQAEAARGRKPATKAGQPSAQKPPPAQAVPVAQPSRENPSPAVAPAPSDPAGHAERGLGAIGRLASANHNLADLVHVRPALAAAGLKTRQEQDALIRRLQQQGLVTVQGRENRTPPTPEQLEANLPASGPGSPAIGFLALTDAGKDRLRGRTVGGGGAPQQAPPAKPVPPPAPGRPFNPADYADTILRAAAGSPNMGDLVDVRRALEARGLTDRKRQDEAIDHVRRAGLAGGVAREGRAGRVTDEQRVAELPSSMPGTAGIGHLLLRPAGEERLQGAARQDRPSSNRQRIAEPPVAPPAAPARNAPAGGETRRPSYPKVEADHATRQIADSLLARHADTHARLSDSLRSADQALRSGRGDYKHYQAAEKALDKQRQQARADLARAAGGNLDVQVSSTNLRGPGAKKFEEGKAFVAALSSGQPVAVRVEQSNSGSKYNEGSRTVSYDTGKGPHDAAHELGHAVEHQVRGVKDAAIAFWRHRVGDERPRKMADVDPDGNFDGDEEGYRDDFLAAFGGDEVRAYYAGKVYRGEHGGNVVATEILSMGIEQLYQDPVGFLKADPEYARFVLGCLAGRVR